MRQCGGGDSHTTLDTPTDTFELAEVEYELRDKYKSIMVAV